MAASTWRSCKSSRRLLLLAMAPAVVEEFTQNIQILLELTNPTSSSLPLGPSIGAGFPVLRAAKLMTRIRQNWYDWSILKAYKESNCYRHVFWLLHFCVSKDHSRLVRFLIQFSRTNVALEHHLCFIGKQTETKLWANSVAWSSSLNTKLPVKKNILNKLHFKGPSKSPSLNLCHFHSLGPSHCKTFIEI